MNESGAQAFLFTDIEGSTRRWEAQRALAEGRASALEPAPMETATDA